MNQKYPAFVRLTHIKERSRSTLVALAVAALSLSPAASLASPAPNDSAYTSSSAQNVDYIGADSAAALDLGFPVLVPGWVPSPFGGSPAIDAGGGYYSLYWMNSGGDPTFLQVTGQVGGSLPAGSPYDLNVQLFINASVQGYGAIHDVTPAYDTVWWIAGGVLYKVESRNSGTDSLSLANSLVTFVPPAVAEPEPEPTVPPVVNTPEPAADESSSNSGGSTTAPGSNDEDAGGQSTDQEETSESSDSSAGVESSTDESGTSNDAGSGQTIGQSETPVPTDGTGQATVNSDGTGGAQSPVIGGDGTGGTVDVFVPRSGGISIP